MKSVIKEHLFIFDVLIWYFISLGFISAWITTQVEAFFGWTLLMWRHPIAARNTMFLLLKYSLYSAYNLPLVSIRHLHGKRCRMDSSGIRRKMKETKGFGSDSGSVSNTLKPTMWSPLGCMHLDWFVLAWSGSNSILPLLPLLIKVCNSFQTW